MQNLKNKKEIDCLLKVFRDADHKNLVATFIVYEGIYDKVMEKYKDFDTFYDKYIKNDNVFGLKDIHLMLDM